MSRIVYDTETDGFLNECTKLHVCCTYNVDTGEEWYSTDYEEICQHLDTATELIAHNQIDYDLPVLKEKLYRMGT